MTDMRKSLRPACLVFLLGVPLLLSGHGMRAGAGGAGARFEYKEDLTRVVGMLQLGRVVSGRLDAAGNFIEDPPPALNKPLKPKEPVYEYRSGNLIKGTLKEDGTFVPELGSKVITLKQYLKGYDPEKSPRVYNLPGRIAKNGGERPAKAGK